MKRKLTERQMRLSQMTSYRQKVKTKRKQEDRQTTMRKTCVGEIHRQLNYKPLDVKFKLKIKLM